MSLSASWRFNRTYKLPIAVALNLLLICTGGMFYRNFTQVISPEAIGWFATLVLINIFCFFRVIDVGFRMAWLPKLAISLFLLIFASTGIQTALSTQESLIHLDPDIVRTSCLAMVLLLLLFEGSSLLGEWGWRHLTFEKQTALIQKVNSTVFSPLHLKIIALAGIFLSALMTLAFLTATLLPLARQSMAEFAIPVLPEVASVLIMSIVIVLLNEPAKGKLQRTSIYAGIFILLLSAQKLLLLSILAAWAMHAASLSHESGLRQWLSLVGITLLFIYLSTVLSTRLSPETLLFRMDTQGLFLPLVFTGVIVGLMGAVFPYCPMNSRGRHLINHTGFWGMGIIMGIDPVKMGALSLVLLFAWWLIIRGGNTIINRKKQHIWHIPVNAETDPNS